MAVLGGVAADGSARQRPSVVATPSTATLFNQGTACVSGVSRVPAANLRSVCSAMATTPLLLAFSSRAWHAGSGGAVLSTAALLDVAVRSPEL